MGKLHIIGAFALLLAAIAFPFDTGASESTAAQDTEDYVPVIKVDEALREIHKMAQSLPLKSTSLKTLAPEYAIEKHEELSWEQAVAEANSRFGDRQPARAVFLRKYLGEGSSADRLNELRLPEWGSSFGSGGGHSKGFVIGPVENPSAIISFWISGADSPELRGEPKVSICTAKVDGIDYIDLVFDTKDRLVSVNRRIPRNDKGITFYLGENTSGNKGTLFFHFSAFGPDGWDIESIHFRPTSNSPKDRCMIATDTISVRPS